MSPCLLKGCWLWGWAASSLPFLAPSFPAPPQKGLGGLPIDPVTAVSGVSLQHGRASLSLHVPVTTSAVTFPGIQSSSKSKAWMLHPCQVPT